MASVSPKEHGEYDVIVVGGGPIGLSTAYESAIGRNKSVLVLEQFTSPNEYGSSAGFGRHFRTPYTESYLCELAIETRPLWNKLMSDTGNYKLIEYNGVLWFGDSDVTTPEGNIEEARKNMVKFKEPHHFYDDVNEIRDKFKFIAGAVKAKFTALHGCNSSGGTINVPQLVATYIKFLKNSGNCQILEGNKPTKIDYSDPHLIQVTTDKGVVFKTHKVVITSSVNINEVLETICPIYNFRINTVIYLWCSNYFTISTPDIEIGETNWPIWIYFAPPLETNENGATDSNSYYGFPYNPEDTMNKVRVAAAFTSREEFNFYLYPPPIKERPIDKDALNFSSNFVKESMANLHPDLNPETQSTCVAGFAERLDGKPDPGFVLDYLPNSNKRIVLCTGGWAMKFVPSFGKILSELAIDGNTEFQRLIENMSLSEERDILVPAKKEMEEMVCKIKKKSPKEQALHFQRLL